MGNNFREDTNGATFIEAAVVFPIVLLLVGGLVDLGLMLFSWASLSKATYEGARLAVVSAPVATNVKVTTAAVTSGTALGTPCSVSGGTANKCVEFSIYCIPNSSTSGTCYNSSDNSVSTTHTFVNSAFTKIFQAMTDAGAGAKIDRQQVKISYQTTGLGFVGSKNTPVNVTVELRCMTTELIFISSFLPRQNPQGCTGISTPPGIVVPSFATTLPSEDLADN